MHGVIILFSGKGGVGKTTLSSMVLRQLVRTGCKPVLAVDADPNSTLALTLGVEASETLADLRDRMGEAAQNPGEISKERLMDRYLADLLNEQDGFDLLTMGRPEGPKCYCYVNGLLRRYLSLLRQNYAYILVDCEAGMEYISRLVVDDVETAVFVAEPTPIGLTTVNRIADLSRSLHVKIHRKVVALNKVNDDHQIHQAQKALRGFDAVVQIPYDQDLMGRCVRGEPLDDSAGAASRKAVEELTHWCLGTAAQRTV